MTYDAFGRMVERDSGSVKTSFWYTPIGRVSMVGATENKAYLAAPGGGTVFYDGSNYDFMHKDFLGSARIVSNISTSTIYSDQAISPYGEVYDQFGNISQYPQNFTGDTQGILAGMWDTPNRELTNIGRWLSPDPAGAGWNQYAYPTNPNSFIDPLGLTQTCDEVQLTFWLPGGVTVEAVTICDDDGGGGGSAGGGTVGGTGGGGGAGGAANNCTPLSSGCSNVPTAQQLKQFVQQQCLSQFNNSGGGGFVNFWSMASPLIGPNRLGSTIEDVGGTTAKYGVYQFFNTESQTMAGTPFGSMSGIVAEGIETIAKDVVFPVAAGSTGLQIIAHAGCSTVGAQAAVQMNPLPPGIQF
jgi:RHS repeat-associated protein